MIKYNRPRLGLLGTNENLECSGSLLLFAFAVVVFFYVFPAILAVLDKFEVFVNDLVVLVGLGELLLNDC